mgnify:FL=1
MSRNYGFVKPAPDDTAYVLGGATKLPKIVLQKDGQWGEFLPQYEPQFNSVFDSYGCTIWGSQNGIETLLKRIEVEDKEWNFSERFNYIIAGVRPPGADPHVVLESIRKNKVVPDSLIPMTTSFTEFLTPDPMEKKYMDEAQKFPYIVWHEWVINGNISLAEQKVKMIEALTYSPLLVAVDAWNPSGDKYVRLGKDGHWTVIFGYVYGDHWLCFDSYDHSIKKLDFDFGFTYVKRLYLERVEENLKAQVSILTKIVEALKKAIFLQKILNALGFADREFGAVRSSKWSEVRRAFITKFPLCAVCGKKGTLLSPNECHHQNPFHIHPELELLESNLITLCRVHHLWWGHLGNFKSFNKDVREDARIMNDKILHRP